MKYQLIYQKQVFSWPDIDVWPGRSETVEFEAKNGKEATLRAAEILQENSLNNGQCIYPAELVELTRI